MTKTAATMLYDGECGFCKRWIRRWRALTRDRVDYRPYQEALSSYPQITEEESKKAVQLVLADGTRYSGAQAVFTALHLGGRYRWLLWVYETVPGARVASELVYRLIASHRVFFSKFS